MGNLTAESRTSVGQSQVLAWTPAVSNGVAYTAGDVVGPLSALSGAFRYRDVGATLTIQSLTVFDASNQKAALELLVFAANPAESTFTDNAAPTLHANDLDKIVARLPIATSDYVTSDSKAVASLGGIGKVIASQTADDRLWIAIFTPGTPTYTATNALRLKLGCYQD